MFATNLNHLDIECIPSENIYTSSIIRVFLCNRVNFLIFIAVNIRTGIEIAEQIKWMHSIVISFAEDATDSMISQ